MTLENHHTRDVEIYEILIEFNTPTKKGTTISNKPEETLIIYEGQVLVQGEEEGKFEMATYSPEFVRINRKLFLRKV
jgi:hypothetical protein